MMSAVFKYAYPYAKTRAMKGALLSADDFRSLLKADSYPEFLRILQTTSYAPSLAGQDFNELPVTALTLVLYQSFFRDYDKTIQAVTGESQKFFILLYQKYELINLKTILRGICSHVAPEHVAALLLPTERHTLFSKEKLLALHTVQEVVEQLRKTFFEYPLNQSLHRFEKENEFFPIEMALDLHYYHTLWEEILKLPKEELEIVKKLMGLVTDVLNVSWIIRFKEQYRFSPEEILNYTIQHGYTFTFRDRWNLARLQDAKEILAYLKNTQFSKAITGDESLNTLHVVLTRYVVTQLRKYFIGYPFQIGVILGYVLLKEFEMTDLITIAEAKKYGFSLEQGQKYIVNA
jgi:V/A-type H+-transporting ATPase subunit C